ncbi:hypothetical protein F5Y01DRAFT_289456 [Xylaria sp. FL0043]|nr:hypothetical protein F5Y01DRAFT_289456 [Xylaria sp. FL0043]
MSGLEVLGAVVSTAQLAAYIITVSSKLDEIRRKIRHAPKRLDQYELQLKHLVTITRHMEQNPPLQTKELDEYLVTVQAKIEAIQETLAKFEQSSKSRRRWNIISGDLSRQLDECFGDVSNTMQNMVLLIVSQNSHGQTELKELMAEMATATRQTTITATSLSCPANSHDTVAECMKRKAGSHLFEGLTMKDNVIVSLGNVSSSHGAMPSMAGHVFTDFTASGNRVLHVGNTGYNSEGHIFKHGVVEKNAATMLGDYADLEQKLQHISLQQGSA